MRELKEHDNKKFSICDLSNISTLYINSDFYIAINKKGEVESYLLSYDNRAKEEYENILKSINKKVKSA